MKSSETKFLEKNFATNKQSSAKAFNYSNVSIFE